MKKLIALSFIISLMCLVSCQNNISTDDDADKTTDQLVFANIPDDAGAVYPDFIYEQKLLSELPDNVLPFCENTIPVSGGYHMVMCEDPADPLGYSAFVKDPDGMYTKINLLIPDTIVFDSVKLLAMPSGGGGSGEDTIYLELTADGQTKYIFFTTSLFANEYWWNYEYRGEAPYSTDEIDQLIFDNKKINEQIALTNTGTHDAESPYQ